MAFDPFVQQILRFHPQQVPAPSNVASTKQAFFYYDAHQSAEISGRINYGIWSQSAHNFDRLPSCPTGNCTWDDFESVGWCNKCEDITKTASLHGCDFVSALKSIPDGQANANFSLRLPCNLTLPHGDPLVQFVDIEYLFSDNDTSNYGITVPTTFLWSLNTSHYDQDEHLVFDSTHLGVGSPLSAMAYATPEIPGTDSGDSVPLKISKATECILSFCKRKYHITVSNGVTSIQVKSIDFGTMFNTTWNDYWFDCWKGNDGPVSMTNTSDRISGSFLSPDLIDKKNFAFSIGSQEWTSYAGILADHLDDGELLTFPIGINSAGLAPWPREGPPRTRPATDYLGRVYDLGLEFITESIAAALTQFGLAMVNDTTPGFVETTEIWVKVRWEWLILPMVVTVLSVVFVIVTVMLNRSSNTALWKASLSALLYHGLDSDEYKKEGAMFDKVSCMDGVAEHQKIRLRASESTGSRALGT